MYTVIVADDDINIREGLSSLVDWEEYGFSIIGKAENGKQVLRLFDAERPDLLVTDIRMPGMDGLSVIRSIRESGYSTACLIISAHEEFAYAKEALAYGVENYLLKPVDPDELRESLIAIGAKAGSGTRDYIFCDGVGHDELRSHIMRRLLSNAILGIELEERLMTLGLERGTAPFRCALLRCGSTDPDDLEAAVRLADDTYSGWNGVCFADETGLVVSLLSACQDRTAILDRSQRLASRLTDSVSPVVVVVGPTSPRLTSVHRSFDAAEFVLNALVAHPFSEAFSAEDFQLEEAEADRFGTEEITRCLVTQDDSGLAAHFDGLRTRFRDSDDSGLSRAASLAIGQAYARFLASRDLTWRRVLDGRPWPTAFPEPNDLLSALSTLQAIGSRIIVHTSGSDDASTDLACQLVQLVRMRIQDPGLCMKSISHELGISSAYAGKLFFQETGMHFSHYLNNRRISLSIDRFKNGATSISAVASAAGYSDPKYFSRVFKQITGYLPTQYVQRATPKERDR